MRLPIISCHTAANCSSCQEYMFWLLALVKVIDQHKCHSSNWQAHGNAETHMKHSTGVGQQWADPVHQTASPPIQTIPTDLYNHPITLVRSVHSVDQATQSIKRYN
uniref:Uncharacterized protein n=1 Tax=Eutreptiella gymnastica TaxID=73025 RepID=A0A7S1NQH0_9EUGL|mmetsp:Transcript_71194/g.125241  ORF Transcript_71194/g.125241 Transcript_71194/m.125241 type:complete len:106 (+) Transcript_71194:147-464(+)